MKQTLCKNCGKEANLPNIEPHLITDLLIISIGVRIELENGEVLVRDTLWLETHTPILGGYFTRENGKEFCTKNKI